MSGLAIFLLILLIIIVMIIVLIVQGIINVGTKVVKGVKKALNTATTPESSASSTTPATTTATPATTLATTTTTTLATTLATTTATPATTLATTTATPATTLATTATTPATTLATTTTTTPATTLATTTTTPATTLATTTTTTPATTLATTATTPATTNPGCIEPTDEYNFKYIEILESGGNLKQCEALVDSFKQYALVVQKDGRASIIDLKNKKKLWTTSYDKINVEGPYKLVLQDNNNLVLSGKDGVAIWASNTVNGYNGVSYLMLTHEGVLYIGDDKHGMNIIYHPIQADKIDNCVKADDKYNYIYKSGFGGMPQGATLNKCEGILSFDNKYSMVLQSNGVASLIDIKNKKKLWSSSYEPVNINGPYRLTFQTDHNVVIYGEKDKVVWGSVTNDSSKEYNQLQVNGGKLFIISKDKLTYIFPNNPKTENRPVTELMPVDYNKDTNISSFGRGLCLDGDGEKIYGLGCQQGNQFQLWKFISGLLKHTKSGKCLEGDSDKIKFSSCDSTKKNQKWTIDETKGQLINNEKNNCLTIRGDKFVLEKCSTRSPFQKFYIRNSYIKV